MDSKYKKSYREIHDCKKCFGAEGCKLEYDERKVAREFIKSSLNSGVMLIGQALGGRTQRLSGLPYILEDGEELSQTGRTLEDNLLNPIGYSLYPTSKKKYVYATDTIQCYPKKASKGDRPPSPKEIRNCADWLDKELTLLKPKVVILLGGTATEHFFKKYDNSRVRMKDVMAKRKKIILWNRDINVFSVYHPSYKRYIGESEIIKSYKKAVGQIKKILTIGGKRSYA